MKMRRGSTLDIETLSNIVLLSSDTEEFDATGLAWKAPETYIRGTINVATNKAKVLKSLQIDLICRQTVVIEGLTSAYGIRQSTAIVLSQPRNLEAGEYSFPFELLVPNDAAPSERTPYGRTVYKLTATAGGLGKIGTNLTAERKVTIIATHSDFGGLPPGHSLKTSAFSQNLGPIAADLSSSYLLVGGILDLTLEMPAILRPILLEDIRVEIVQKYDVQALDEKWRHQTSNSDTLVVWSLRTDKKLGVVEQGGDCSMQRQIRMPIEGKLRPTTPDASVTGLKVSHRIEIVIVYTPLEDNPKKHKKELRIGSAATISSCHCTLQALQLPAYEPHENATARSRVQCMCEMGECARQAIYGQYVGSADIEPTFRFHPDAALPSKSGNSDHRFERVESIEVAYGPAYPAQ